MKKKKSRHDNEDDDSTLSQDVSRTEEIVKKEKKKKKSHDIDVSSSEEKTKKKKRKIEDNGISVENSTQDEHDHQKKKRKKSGHDNEDEDSTLSQDNTDVSRTEEIVKKEKKKRKSHIDMSSSEEKAKKKRRKIEDNNIPVENSTQDEHGNASILSTGKKTKEKEMKTEVIPEADSIVKVRDKKERSIFRAKHKMKRKEVNSIKKLLEQRTTVGSEIQVTRIRNVCNEVSYTEVMDELLPKLKKKMAKKADLQKEGKDNKIEKVDMKIKKLKEAAVEKATELKGNAVLKLDSIENAINRKMKKKGRKRSFVVGGMAQERFSKGKTGLGNICQDAVTVLQQRSKEARSEVRQAAKETKSDLEEQLKAFTQKIEELDTSWQGTEPQSAFSGAAFVKGYLC